MYVLQLLPQFKATPQIIPTFTYIYTYIVATQFVCTFTIVTEAARPEFGCVNIGPVNREVSPSNKIGLSYQ